MDEGVLLQDVSLNKNNQTSVVQNENTVKIEPSDVNMNELEEIEEKIKNLKLSLDQKADSVVSYQIIQHRREIEELKNQIVILTDRITCLEDLLSKEREIAASNEETDITPRKKKNFLKGIFGF